MIWKTLLTRKWLRGQLHFVFLWVGSSVVNMKNKRWKSCLAVLLYYLLSCCSCDEKGIQSVEGEQGRKSIQ